MARWAGSGTKAGRRENRGRAAFREPSEGSTGVVGLGQAECSGPIQGQNPGLQWSAFDTRKAKKPGRSGGSYGSGEGPVGQGLYTTHGSRVSGGAMLYNTRWGGITRRAVTRTLVRRSPPHQRIRPAAGSGSRCSSCWARRNHRRPRCWRMWRPPPPGSRACWWPNSGTEGSS